MGTIVSTNKLIGAFRDNDGHPCYVMFERTYELNVCPPQPRWNACAIGGIEAMMRRVFSAGAQCEGGMLLGRWGRRVKPESCIRGWLKELANPVAMPDLALKMQVGTEWDASITTEELQVHKPVLLAAGCQASVEALESGSAISLSLYADSALLSAIYGGLTMSAWRVIPAYEVPLHRRRDKNLGWDPKKAGAFEVVSPRCLRVSEKNESMLFPETDGSWRCAGWAYNIVAEYIRGLWQAEMREPGSYRQRIKTYRNAIESAALIPLPGTTVGIDRSLPATGYLESQISTLLTSVSGTEHGTEFRFRVPADEDNIFRLTTLPPEHVRWIVPVAGVEHFNRRSPNHCLT